MGGYTSASEADASAWDSLLARCGGSPFMRHAYLSALHESGSAVPDTGWLPQFVTLWRDGELHAACDRHFASAGRRGTADIIGAFAGWERCQIVTLMSNCAPPIVRHHAQARHILGI